MDTLVSTISQDALALCEAGRPNDALKIVRELPEGPYRWLVEGGAIALTEPGRAKDLLSKAAGELSGNLRDKANIWLACCYWSTGEKSEALAIIDSVEPQADEIRFLWGFSRSPMVEGPEALECLERVAHLVDQISNPLWKGRFYNQRGAAHRRLKNLDAAILAYSEAKFWFQEAENVKLSAIAANNLGELLSKSGQFDDAHLLVDEAIAEFKRIGANVYLAQAYDTKAGIFLEQRKFIEACQTAPRSVKILERREQRELEARSLITEAIALSETGKYLEAFGRLERAREIGDYLGNTDLLFDVSWQVRELSKKMRNSSEYSLIAIALKEGSIRSAAKKMGINHSALIKLMDKHGLTVPNVKKDVRLVKRKVR